LNNVKVIAQLYTPEKIKKAMAENSVKAQPKTKAKPKDKQNAE